MKEIVMNWSRFALVILVFILAGCQGVDESLVETPTPFSALSGATARAPSGEPIAITLANLAANPGLFEGSTLQLHGAFQPMPTLICEQDAFPSPATWGLVGEGLQANATGFDKPLNTLIEEGQEITVEGRWLLYDGPVGCGKNAPVQEVWYLSTSRILDPNPLARRVPEGEMIAGAPSEPGDIVAPPEETIEFEVEEEVVEEATTAAIEATETAVPATIIPSPTVQGAAPTLVITLTPSLTPAPGQATATPTGATVTPGAEGTETTTPTATGTSSSSDGSTATPEESTATPSATPQTSNGGVNDMGSFEFEDLVIGNLASSTIDTRFIYIDDSTSITLTVAPATSADIVISIIDPNENIVLDNYNNASAGQVETVTDFGTPEDGEYEIQISTADGASSEYALMVMDDISYSFNFMGTLDSGMQRSDTLLDNNDHFWFFNSVDGDSVSIQITPNGEEDAYVELYGPDGSRLETIDDTGSGEAESLADYSILESGMYSVRIGEFDFTAMSYQIVVNINGIEG